MQKKINIQNATQAMAKAGLTQTAIADALDVSKEAVSQWLNDKSFPRPNKLLHLGKLLKLSLDELVIKDEANAPVVAFRKRQGARTKDHHVEKAQEMGRFLRHLAPYLPFDTLEMPPVLKQPQCDYDYLQKVALKVRHDINLSPEDIIDFTHLIRRFRELQAVIVPVLWGNKDRHENAVHIYLPDSQTTWVYLNLDVNIHDFKFWMAHELGHCLSPSLSGEEAEDFADAFAGALLFPKDKAKQAYQDILAQPTNNKKIECLKHIAIKELISPNTIYVQANCYAEANGLPKLEFSSGLYGWITKFNQGYKNLSAALLGDVSQLNARDYIKKTEDSFETPFFDTLRLYLKQTNKGAGIVQSVTDMPLLDTQSMHAELT
jgi:transcriptional regulator with XRE-family HTH domain